MFQRLIMGWVLSFLLKEIEKAEGAIKWDELRKELDEKVRYLLPGTWFDDEGVALCDGMLGICQRALGDDAAEKRILQLLAARKYADAALALKDLIIGAMVPHFEHLTAHEVVAHDVLRSYQIV
jgi:hypothetical protein